MFNIGPKEGKIKAMMTTRDFPAAFVRVADANVLGLGERPVLARPEAELIPLGCRRRVGR